MDAENEAAIRKKMDEVAQVLGDSIEAFPEELRPLFNILIFAFQPHQVMVGISHREVSNRDVATALILALKATTQRLGFEECAPEAALLITAAIQIIAVNVDRGVAALEEKQRFDGGTH